MLDIKTAQRVQATLRYDITSLKQKAKEWIVFAAVAPELPGQSRAQSSMTPRASEVKEAGERGRSLLRARVNVTAPKQQQQLEVRVTYAATLNSRHLRPIAAGETLPKVAALTDQEKKFYLEARGDFDFKAEAFRKWLSAEKLERGENETEIDFARRVFQFLQTKGKYEFKSGSELRASAVCRTLKTDCGGFSTLFASIMRASGIPARTLYGRWAKSSDPDEKLNGQPYVQWHVKAEFYATGVGWVPVDVALALDDKSPDRLAYFGHDEGDFITQHVDSNLELDTIHFGKDTVGNLQAPVWWSTGEGSADPWTAKESWEVKVLK